MTMIPAVLAVVLAVFAFVQTLKLSAAKKRLNEFSQRYKPVIDIDKYVKQGEDKIEAMRGKEREIQAEIDSGTKDLARLNDEIALASDAAYLVEVGYYEPRYEFEDITRYEAELRIIRDQQKAMLREDGTENPDGAAAITTRPLLFNNSRSQGRAAQKKTLKLILRAFNGESDSFIARVSYRNVDTMKKRIFAAFDAINKITENYNFCQLSHQYLNLRIQELELVYEWEEAKQKEKEEQAFIRQQMREEEKAVREAERDRQQAEKDEAKYKELLEKAQKEVKVASQKDKEQLNSKINELLKRIAEIEEKKRAISNAMLTKAGVVYIISNIGSFGDNIYKIGMTRRQVPEDRVKELGDASVPFPFDVHALISTSDAPRLENALHKHFDARRLNLENRRKEFFHVSIDEIKNELDVLKDQLGIESELRLTLLAEAKEYRMSEARRRHQERTRQQN